MLPRVCVVWLIALILSPLSAPFSVGDASPVKNATSHALPVARSPLRAKRVIAAAARTQVQRTAPAGAPPSSSLTGKQFGKAPLVLPLRI